MAEDPVAFRKMRWLDLIGSLLFAAFAGVQLNDPDSLPWILIYGGTSALSMASFAGYLSPSILYLWLIACLIPALPLMEDLRAATPSSFASYGMADLAAERAREGLGLLVAACWTLFLCWRARNRTGAIASTTLLVLMGSGLASCAVATVSAPIRQPELILAPDEIPHARHERRTLVRKLDNPRGLLIDADGTLLVAVAGNGDPTSAGGILRFDLAPNGEYRDSRNLLADQPSRNLLDLVRRDEVFGVAAIRKGQDQIRATAAYYDGPSRIFTVHPQDAREISRVAGNLNDIAWHPTEKAWFAVSSSTNQLVRLQDDGDPLPVTSFAPLENGQEAVPGYLRHDPQTDDLLVSLFSGSPLGESGGDGTEILPGAGKVVRVNPRTGVVHPMVAGLTAPTDLEVSADGRTLWVLELCDRFVGPVTNRQQMLEETTHGGFRRFSGRLLQIDRTTGQMVEIARNLDTPTNLTTHEDWLLVSTGMGTAGRQIPTSGSRSKALEGRVEAIHMSPTRK